MTALQTTLKILEKLISFPTVSSDSNLELIGFINDYLTELGAETEVYEDITGDKANLFATIGPKINNGIILSGHTDVVPVEGQNWHTDPFLMTIDGNRIFGRGSCDMKGFIAATLACAPKFAKSPLKRPVHFAFTYDEEVGCIGGQALVKEIEKRKIYPAVAIIGEPTQMRIIQGHKGCYEYSVNFVGVEGHGALPDQGVNAIEYAVRYVTHLLSLRDELCKRAPNNSPFIPPWTTLQVGRLNGGVARNVIPGSCTIDWEMRPVSKNDSDFVKLEMKNHIDNVLKPEMKFQNPAADIITKIIAEVEDFELVENSEAIQIISELTGSKCKDVVSFGTEAGLFQKIGISAVVCGPGSIEQAHKPNEYIEISQLEKTLELLDRLEERLIV